MAAGFSTCYSWVGGGGGCLRKFPIPVLTAKEISAYDRPTWLFFISPAAKQYS